MNNVEGKYLPVGTVVLLKGGTKKLMITGFCTMDAEKQGPMYDYCGCLYPEGIINTKQTALFNHEQIQQVFFVGYKDDEEMQFKAKLTELVAQTTYVQNMDVNAPTTQQNTNF